VAAAFAPAGAVRAQSLVKVDGSSTMFPVTEAVAQEFQIRKRGTARVTVGISGTTGGFRKFCAGDTDLQDASRPIRASEMQACREGGVSYFELPVAFDAVTVAVNPGNTWARSLTVAQLKKIWEPAAQGRVMRWSDIDSSWPNEPLVLFGPGEDSGTFDFFTEAINGTVRSSRRDYTASEDDNVIVRGIEDNLYALGYVPYAYYAAQSGRLEAVAIDSGAGPVAPLLENVANRRYTPLSRPLFIYVSARSVNRPEVRAFVEFFLQHGAPFIRQVQYLPLGERAYALALENFRGGKLGTAYGDAESGAGLDMEELLGRHARL